MTQHPKGAELVRELVRALAKDDLTTYGVIRNAIIALIDDPVRAAGPELLKAAKAAKAVLDRLSANGLLSYFQDEQLREELRAAIAKAEAPADAEGGDDAEAH